MNIPQQFELFSQTWNIRAGNPKEMADNNGLCYSDSNEILLNPQQTTDSMRQTLIHELLHCIEMKLHLEMTEQQIDSIALGLIHLFNTNPEMLGILVKQQPQQEDNDE